MNGYGYDGEAEDSMSDDNGSTAHNVIIIATTVLMGLIAIATAWSGFQATKWGGNMSNSYAAANVARSNSVLAYLTANQLMMVDIQLFAELVDAYAAGDQERIDFYSDRMRDEFKPALEAWLALDPLNNPDAPKSPFDMAEYQLAKRAEGEDLEEQAVSLSQEALDSNQNGDNYVMTTVILASGLFFSGIATRFRWPAIELVILIVAILAFAYGTYQILTYPILL